MAKILLEDLQGPFIVDKTKDGAPKIVSESVNGQTISRIPGRFSVCNQLNGNNRIYPRSVWEKNLAEDSPLMKSIKQNAAFGLLEHPRDGHVDLNSPISHIVVEAKLVEGTDEVHGEIAIVNTAEGNKLKALIEAGYNPLVSSRGFGSIEHDAVKGADIVQDDFICEGWDVVFRPSFANAQLTPNRESKSEPKTESNAQPSKQPVTETAKEDGTMAGAQAVAQKEAHDKMKKSGAFEKDDDEKDEKAKKEEAVQSKISPTVEETTGASSSKQTQNKTMKIEEIRARLDALKNAATGNLGTTQLSESVSTAGQLHRDISVWGAEDASRAWDAQKLHGEVASVEEKLNQIHAAPVNEAKALKEKNGKILQLAKLVTEKAVTFKQKFAQLSEQNGKLKTTATEAITRGRKWKQRAESIQEKAKDLDLQLDVVSTSLDMLVPQYNADVVKLSRKLITLEHGDKLTEDQKKGLKEAKHPNQVYSILEAIKKLAKPVTEGKEKPESGKPEAETQAKTKISESKETEKPSTQGVEEGDLPAAKNPAQLSESLAITKRLSAAVAA